MKEHVYRVGLEWTGNDGPGTSSYRSYRREHTLVCPGKPPLFGSSDVAFRGDPARYSPEDLLVGSLSACHMLWYLHLCAVNHVIIQAYTDAAIGYMSATPDGSGAFTRVILRPAMRLGGASDAVRAIELHTEAHHMCFIARSMNFPVDVEPTLR